MVERVTGKANGSDIIFTKNDGGKWEAILPPDLSGEYIVELFAEDEAGNQAFMCKTVFVICGHSLEVKVVDRGFDGMQNTHGYDGQYSTKGYDTDLIDRDFATGEQKRFYTDMDVRGYTVEHDICSRDVC